MTVDTLSDEKLAEIKAEFADHLKGLSEFPSRMHDGPGAVSAFYTSLALGDVLSLVTELQSSRATIDGLRGERDAIAAKARQYAGHYPEASDGRNTFILLAEWIEAREEATLTTARADGIEEAAKAGWNACRRSIYAVCEDVGTEGEKNRSDTENAPRHHFGRGQMTAAKSIARGFNAMEAADDENFIAAIRALHEPAREITR